MESLRELVSLIPSQPLVYLLPITEFFNSKAIIGTGGLPAPNRRIASWKACEFSSSSPARFPASSFQLPWLVMFGEEISLHRMPICLLASAVVLCLGLLGVSPSCQRAVTGSSQQAAFPRVPSSCQGGPSNLCRASLFSVHRKLLGKVTHQLRSLMCSSIWVVQVKLAASGPRLRRLFGSRWGGSAQPCRVWDIFSFGLGWGGGVVSPPEP